VHSLKCQKDLKSNATSQTLRKTRTSKSQNKQERNVKNKDRINEIETTTKKPYKDSMKQKAGSLKK
jgi:hypothetical protein